MKATTLFSTVLFGLLTLTNAFVLFRANSKAVVTLPPTVTTTLFASTNFVGPVQESVQTALTEEFAPAHLQVINESHGRLEDESHFKVIIVSEAFQDKRLVQRHRLINGCLMKDGELPFHALTITAKTCLLYTSPSPRDQRGSRMPSSA